MTVAKSGGRFGFEGCAAALASFSGEPQQRSKLRSTQRLESERPQHSSYPDQAASADLVFVTNAEGQAIAFKPARGMPRKLAGFHPP